MSKNAYISQDRVSSQLGHGALPVPNVDIEHGALKLNVHHRLIGNGGRKQDAEGFLRQKKDQFRTVSTTPFDVKAM